MSDMLSKLEKVLGRVGEVKIRTAQVQPKGLPPGEWLDQGVYLCEHSVSLSSRHGKVGLQNVRGAIKTLAPWGAAEEATLLDVETTGLAGGTGTYAFMAGVGTIEGEVLIVRQLFLTSPQYESSWLYHLRRIIPEEVGFVTYNGKRFDISLLEGRFILNRLPFPERVRGHLDLLYLARSFWRGVFPSCSLGDVERYALGVERESQDIPGWLIPELYHAFLTDGDASRLSGVFYHNYMDIVSLAALKGKLASLLEGHGKPHEGLKAGDLWASKGSQEKAFALWRKAVEEMARADEPLKRLAYAHKSAGRYKEAASLFEELLQLEPRSIECLVELSKVYEHRLKDLDLALAYARRALQVLMELRPLIWNFKEERAALLHRVKRIEEKCARRERHKEVLESS